VFEEIILDELNVKNIAYGRHGTELAELRAKPDFRRLGPRLGAQVKQASAAIESLSVEETEKLAEGEAIRLSVEGLEIDLEAKDVVIQRLPKDGLAVGSEGPLVVAIETELSTELVEEGLAREVVNKIQNMRKSAGLEVTQRIQVECVTGDELWSAISRHKEYLKTETLSRDLTRGIKDGAGGVEWDINGHSCAIRLLPLS